MAAKGGHIDFMFLAPPYPAAGSDAESKTKNIETFTLYLSLSRTPPKALPIPRPAPVTMETLVAMIRTDGGRLPAVGYVL